MKVNSGLFSISLIALVAVGNAQSSTLIINDDREGKLSTESMRAREYKNIVVVPFESRMYGSDIDKELVAKTDMPVSHIRQLFRENLAQGVAEELGVNHVITLSESNSEMLNDLRYLYASSAYKYKVLPEEDQKQPESKGLMKAMDKVKGAFESSDEPEIAGTSIRDGQLYSLPEAQEKYMSITVTDPKVWRLLSAKYEAAYFVFLNQLDLKAAPGTDYREFESDNYRRLAKVHFTIYDRFGTELSGGAAKSLFSSTINTPDRISRAAFPSVCQQISKKVPTANGSESQHVVSTRSADMEKSVQHKEKAEEKESEKGGEHEDIFDDY